MAKKKKEQAPRKKDTRVVFRVTVTHGLEVRDYLITAHYYEIDIHSDSTVHLYNLEHDQVASFRHWVAIENLKEAEAWGEKFEKLAKFKPVQGDMFEPHPDLGEGFCSEWKARVGEIKQGLPISPSEDLKYKDLPD